MGVSPFKDKMEEFKITEESLMEGDGDMNSPTKISLAPEKMSSVEQISASKASAKKGSQLLEKINYKPPHRKGSIHVVVSSGKKKVT